MAFAHGRWVAASAIACLLVLSGCAGTPEAPGVSFSNTDRSAERRAEAGCRADAGTGDVGSTAAFHACMARFRRPPDDE